MIGDDRKARRSARSTYDLSHTPCRHYFCGGGGAAPRLNGCLREEPSTHHNDADLGSGGGTRYDALPRWNGGGLAPGLTDLLAFCITHHTQGGGEGAAGQLTGLRHRKVGTRLGKGWAAGRMVGCVGMGARATRGMA